MQSPGLFQTQGELQTWPSNTRFGKRSLTLPWQAFTGQLNLGNRLMEFEHTIKQRIEEGSRKMVLDLSGLTYIDSAGLGMVATCAGVMSRAGGNLVVVSAVARSPRCLKSPA